MNSRLNELSKDKTFLQELRERSKAYFNTHIISRGLPYEITLDGKEKPIDRYTDVPPNVKIIDDIFPCWDTPWNEFQGNKIYFDNTPIDLPKPGNWKYRLPMIYDVSKKTIKVSNDLTYPNVSSIKIEDGAKGRFREKDHYFVRSNGEVWIKGSRPYLNLVVTVNWKDNQNIENSTRIPVPPDDFIVNGKLVSTSDVKVRVPYRPCYEGFENVYEIESYVATFHAKYCAPEGDLNEQQLGILLDGPASPGNLEVRYDDQGNLLAWQSYTKFKEGIFALVEEYTEKEYEYDEIDYRGFRTGNKLKRKDLETTGKTVVEYIGGKTVIEAFGYVTDPNTGKEIRVFLKEWETGMASFSFMSASIETVTTNIKEYTSQTRFSDLLNCECVELNIITPPTVNTFLTPDCDCTVTVSEQVYIICPDQFTDKAYQEYLAGRQTPPELIDLIEKNEYSEYLIPTYTRIISANPCEFGDGSSRVYQNFASRDIRYIVKNEIDGLFDSKESIECYATSSVQSVKTKPYYYDVTECGICDISQSYFSVAFGHYAGSGSLFEQFEDEDSPSRSIFSQYRLKLLDQIKDNFTYYNNATSSISEMIYVISFNRDAMKDKIDSGNFQINLAELNGTSHANNVYTGSNVQVSSSNKVLTLIDNSGDLTEIQSCSDKNAMYSFDIVSGSLLDGIHSTGLGNHTNNTSYKTYGKVYPNSGVIVLDASLLNSELNFNTVSGSNINGDNSYKLFTSLSGSASINNSSKFRNARQRNIRNYSVRIAPVECNYSNNPTYLKEYGRIKHACFIDNPVTYVTTVGLYNASRELVAIAKLSKPIKKTKDDTLDIKIRLGM